MFYTVLSFVATLVLPPSSFAEISGTGRVNSPWTANLALRAGTARQGDSLAVTEVSGTPSLFSGQMIRGGTFWVLFLAVEKKCLARGCDYPLHQSYALLR